MQANNRVFPLLRRTDLAKFLSGDDLRELERFGDVLSRRPGTTLFRQGEPAETFFLLLRGSVELRARPPGRRFYRTIEVIGDGCTFGDETILLEGSYLAGARVMESSKALAISRTTFDKIVEVNADIAVGLLRCAGSCLIQTIRRSAVLTQAPAEVALELLLRELALDFADSNVLRSNGKVPIRITHAQLAGMLHLARETVSRMLAHLAEQGTVEMARGLIRVRVD